MKDEIKEIIDRLERIDHKEYIAFEFADSATFDEMARCFEERKKLADCITNLQEEVNKLTAESTEWENRTYHWQDKAEVLQEENDRHFKEAIRYENACDELEIRIDKAMEYIKDNSAFLEDDEYELFNKRDLLNILQGDSND